MFVGLISDIEQKEAHKELSLWALGRALREKGVLTIILREPAHSGNTSEFLSKQMAVCTHDREILKQYGVFDQISGFAGVETAACAAFAASVWAEGKKVPICEEALFLLPQLRYHGISEKPEVKGKYLFVDVSRITPEILRVIREIGEKREIAGVILVQYGKEVPDVAPLRIEMQISPEDTEGYIGALWMAEGVLADRYAGTALAMIHEKPFLSFSGGQEAEKTRGLLERFALTEHIYIPGEKRQGTAQEKSEKDVSGSRSAQQSGDGRSARGYRFEIQDEVGLRKELRAMREQVGSFLNEELSFAEENMLVKCPVKIPVSQCSACGACEAVCPENAIRMEQDAHGFLHPVVDEALCDECGWCSDVCIKRGQRQLVQFPDDSYPRFYIAKGKTQRAGAYSGVFGQLMRYLIKERDAVIFGSVLNEELKPVVVWTQDPEEAEQFAEKRYLVNDTREAFRKVKELLDDNRFVVYTGSACECAGLRGYLRRHYPKLFLCELLCHETVSHKAFGLYTDMLSRRKDSKLTKLSFGDFSANTKADSMVMRTVYENGETGRLKYAQSRYMQMIEQQLAVNEACANCSYLGKKRVGDITLTDFQKNVTDVPKAWADSSVVIVSTEKGGRVLKQLIDVETASVEFEPLLRFLYKKTAAMPNERAAALRALEKGDLAGILKNVAKK